MVRLRIIKKRLLAAGLWACLVGVLQ